LGQTLVFSVISVSLELLLGLGTALILNQNFRGRGVVRAIAILPWALPTAIISVAWVWIFNDQYGLINDLLLRLGVISHGINWLGEQPWATTAVILADVWKTAPFITLILLAGLQAIPPELYEAHALDGAGPWQSFVRLTLPLLAPQIFVALLFRFAQAFGVFDLIQVMTGGGPAGSTETVAVYIYNMTLRYLDFGYGAALVVAAFGLLGGGLALVAVVFKALSKAY
jgi:multiple sugar transport system permease protein